MYAFIAGNHEYCVTLQTARAHLAEQAACQGLQKAVFRLAICGILERKRRPFATQYTVFWKVRSNMLNDRNLCLASYFPIRLRPTLALQHEF